MSFEPRFRHSIKVRYGEVDQQGVVFNAHYMAYIDDALEEFVASAGDFRALGWDMMLKRIELEWQGSVGSGDTIDIDVAPTRWGNTSFELGYAGSVVDQTDDGVDERRPVFTANVLYVSVELGTANTLATPPEVIEGFGPATDRL